MAVDVNKDRDKFLVELYTGLGVIINEQYTQIPYLEFRTRMQQTSTDDLRKQVLELRKIIK